MKPYSSPYRFFAFLMAVLILVTSTGFTIDRHYCKGELKTISLFVKAKSCHEIGMGMQNCPYHKKQENLEEKNEDKNCCSNKTEFVKSDQDQIKIETTTTNYDYETPIIHFEIVENTPLLSTSIPSNFLYKPPLLRLNIPVLFQSFLL